jgi:hypothetical protein
MSPATKDQRHSSLSLVHLAEDRVVYCVVLLGLIVDVVVVPAFGVVEGALGVVEGAFRVVESAFGVVEGAFGVVETVLFFFPALTVTV